MNAGVHDAKRRIVVLDPTLNAESALARWLTVHVMILQAASFSGGSWLDLQE
jgi:hypothetical protein